MELIDLLLELSGLSLELIDLLLGSSDLSLR
jgi:hypothetical protein